MKATYKEFRSLSGNDLRALCIRNNWYTRGTCEEYERLFSLLHDERGCPENMTTEKLAEVAEDIMEHSDITDYTITAVMFELARACNTFFEEQ